MYIDQLECVCNHCRTKQLYIRILVNPKMQLAPASIQNYCNCCGEELTSKDIIWEDIVGPSGDPGDARVPGAELSGILA
ncbi:hypothetical protein SDC9_130868 [bioreactor metagenome]|uniref:Uncharacterized protein n=1 Tax=bioreactor metagenome TaxID=1076179 RepID=A0A645D3M9_9ZZZZ